MRDRAHRRASPSAERTARRRRRERSGRLAEAVAAVLLMAKGYRIVAWRARTPAGEIDLIAVRGRRLAFVEVKYRNKPQSLDDAVSRRQAARLARAAEQWAWNRPAYRSHLFGLDAIYLCPWRLPRHLTDGLQPL